MISVKEITDRNYQTISILGPLTQLSERFDGVGYLVVIDDFSTYKGILTKQDLLQQPIRKLADIDLRKPMVSIHDTLKNVVKLMFTRGYWELPVFDEEQFIGVITMNRIVKRVLRKDFHW